MLTRHGPGTPRPPAALVVRHEARRAATSLIAREVHQLMAGAVQLGAALLSDEPALVAGFMRDGIPGVLQRFTEVLGPLLKNAMGAGIVARRDPQLMTEWMVRMGLSLLFAPPRRDVRVFSRAGVQPLFEVESES